MSWIENMSINIFPMVLVMVVLSATGLSLERQSVQEYST